MKNWDLLKDTEITLRIKLGSKTLLLADVRKLDIGSTVELDRLANDPIELMMGDTVVAHGEVVVVDGNFGIQITTMVRSINYGN